MIKFSGQKKNLLISNSWMQKATWIREVLKWVDLKGGERKRRPLLILWIWGNYWLQGEVWSRWLWLLTVLIYQVFFEVTITWFFFSKYLAMQWERGGKTGCFLIFTNTNSGWQYLKRLELVIYGWQVKMLEKWTIETGYMSIPFWMVSSLVVMLILYKIEKHQ